MSTEAENEEMSNTTASVEVQEDHLLLLEQARNEVAQLKDQMLREQAETQNYRKRVQRDVENARKFALDKFVADLLPVVDNLERALHSSGQEQAIAAVMEGIDLTYKSFLDVLRKHQVETIHPQAEAFNPELHEAITAIPHPEMEPNRVMDVVQKGSTLSGRLVRPARVVVSKAVE